LTVIKGGNGNVFIEVRSTISFRFLQGKIMTLSLPQIKTLCLFFIKMLLLSGGRLWRCWAIAFYLYDYDKRCKINRRLILVNIISLPYQGAYLMVFLKILTIDLF